MVMEPGIFSINIKILPNLRNGLGAYRYLKILLIFWADLQDHQHLLSITL